MSRSAQGSCPCRTLLCWCRCSTCLCCIGISRSSKGSCCAGTSRCSTWPCGVDTSRSSTGSCCPGKCSSDLCDVDMSLCSTDLKTRPGAAQTCPCSTILSTNFLLCFNSRRNIVITIKYIQIPFAKMHGIPKNFTVKMTFCKRLKLDDFKFLSQFSHPTLKSN
jgi:hypothetical protein